MNESFDAFNKYYPWLHKEIFVHFVLAAINANEIFACKKNKNLNQEI